jgi:hypothetical protein
MARERYRLPRGLGRVILATAWLGFGAQALAAEPTVTNVRATQQQGTQLMAVWYDDPVLSWHL